MNAKKVIFGIFLGMAAGIIDLIPMFLQKLTWDAKLSAFSMWIISGFLISVTELKIYGILKGILISFLLLIPCAFLIGWEQPVILLPISIMTLILGSLLGLAIEKIGK